LIAASSCIARCRATFRTAAFRTETYPAKRNEQTIRCGKDEFVVLGDNRESSLDSRYYGAGAVSRQNILGMLVY